MNNVIFKESKQNKFLFNFLVNIIGIGLIIYRLTLNINQFEIFMSCVLLFVFLFGAVSNIIKYNKERRTSNL